MGKGRVVAVIGGQYGSEGKGVIVGHIADRYQVHVRVGSHNAGHSFQHLGRVWKMQSIPVGWKNPDATLVIGRGALVSPPTLLRELREIEQFDPTIWLRLFIDGGAGILDEHHHANEGGTRGEIHQRIGSTGEGVGAARIARLRREPYIAYSAIETSGRETEASGFRHFRDLVKDPEWSMLAPLLHENTPLLIHGAIWQGGNVLLEGSQGVGLSVTHGPWPYVTTTDCGAAQLCADVGIPPMYLTEVLCVLRTFPIRVAGNSGPLKDEITWEQLSKELGRDVQEKTTVTHKIRRIGRWDEELVGNAVLLNAPTSFAVTFTDYLDTANEGATEWEQLTPQTRTWLNDLGNRYNMPIQFIGTGGKDWSVIEQ